MAASLGASPSSSSTVLETAVSGRPLGLSDIFHRVGEWKEDRYDVADRTEIRGIGVLVGLCNSNFSNVPALELRLARRFAKLTMSVGQANNSRDSDALLVVEILANNQQVDLRRIAFDELQPFDLSIPDVNALQIRMWIDPESCRRTSKEVIGVVENLVISG